MKVEGGTQHLTLRKANKGNYCDTYIAFFYTKVQSIDIHFYMYLSSALFDKMYGKTCLKRL